jgi:hypothetical protein
MKKNMLFVLTGSLIMALFAVGTVYAQEDNGYPVDILTEEPVESLEELDPVCEGIRIHPVLDGLSTQYAVTYDELKAYYCDLGMSVGEIALALQTNQRTDGETSIEELFSQRSEDGLGWGEIWQSLNLIGSGNAQEGQGMNVLMRNMHRNEFQEQIKNEGEDDQIQNEAQNQDENGQNPEMPLGLEEDKGEPETPREDQGQGNDPEGPQTPSGPGEGNGSGPVNPPNNGNGH